MENNFDESIIVLMMMALIINGDEDSIGDGNPKEIAATCKDIFDWDTPEEVVAGCKEIIYYNT